MDKMQASPGQPPAYAPPPPYTAQPGGMHSTTVITSAPMPALVIAQGPVMSSKPTIMTCPSCQANIITRVESNPSVKTHIIAALFCLFIFWPCTCLPYCMSSCNNADHYCPNCNAYIGGYRF